MKHCIILIIFIAFSAFSSTVAQERTIGLLINEDNAFSGYTLFAPMPYTVTYLIDNNGLLVHSWESEYKPRFAAHLLENGSLIRAGKPGLNPVFNGGGAGGIVQEIAWDGSLDWEFEYSSDEYLLHHEIRNLPDGNLLMIAWEYKSADELIEAGRDPVLIPDENELWPDHIIEVEPTGQSGGNVVWEWHIWDHLIQDFDPSKENYGVVADHPELMDLNFIYNITPDWNHTNSIDYNEEYDQILLSLHHPSEIIVIDHSTTTEEAAGHSGGRYGKGGDFLYRWGNPQVYRAGSEEDRKLYKQHDARWIEPGLPGDGNITIFNNGWGRPDENYSSIEEIEPPIDGEGNYLLTPGSAYGPEEPVWIYGAENPEMFFSQKISGAHRLPNGNTLICKGRGGDFFEVTSTGEKVWQYINPVNENGPMNQGDPPEGNNVFRIHRYAPDFSGFEGRDLTPGDPIERYITDITDGSDKIPGKIEFFSNYPNPFNATTSFTFSSLEPQHVTLAVYDLLGGEVKTLLDEHISAGMHHITFDASDLASGIYFYSLQAGDRTETKRMVLLK